MEIIHVKEQNGKQVVSAKELHEFLEIGTPLSKWLYRMFEYGFEQDKDWTKLSIDNQAVDYALTLDCAKEISMLQRSEKGKQARLYFIECEKKLKQPQQLTTLDMLELAIKNMREQNKELAEVKNDIKELKAKTNTSDLNYFTIAGYCSLIGKKISLTEAAKYGRKATYLCGQNGYITGVIADPRFGKVKTYPKEVLQEVIK